MPRPTALASEVPDIEQLFHELASLRANLEHAQRLATLGTIAGLIAHEFNNILTPIMSYAQMALAAPDDAALARKALEHAASGSERAAQIATAILDFARDDLQVSDGSRTGLVWKGGTTPKCSARADVLNCIRLVFECIARAPGKDGITLEVACQPRLPAAAIRPVALQQVLMNLVLNARRALAGGGLLVVRARQSDSLPRPPAGAAVGATATSAHAEGWLVITVEDNGKGIEPEMMEKLFRAFATGVRSSAAGTDRGGGGVGKAVDVQRGTGLGLVVCRQLVAQADGAMWAESAPGKGARFTVAIPAAN